MTGPSPSISQSWLCMDETPPASQSRPGHRSDRSNDGHFDPAPNLLAVVGALLSPGHRLTPCRSGKMLRDRVDSARSGTFNSDGPEPQHAQDPIRADCRCEVFQGVSAYDVPHAEDGPIEGFQ